MVDTDEPSAHPAPPVYSQRLGALTPRQFQAALTRFGLGTFLDATPVARGLFGQNVFVRSSHGEYVLRGAPHYPWQFPKERFAVTLLHERTSVPVAYPYLLDPASDIFGWPYLLMPRLPGRSPADWRVPEDDQRAIARALGEHLAQLHQLALPAAGLYSLASGGIEPFAEGFAHWIVADTRQWLAAARANGAATTLADEQWVDQVIADAHVALTEPFQPCFVMNDYNPGNVLVDQIDGAWRVTGLVDFMEYYVGDGEADLMRLLASYLAPDQPRGQRLAQDFAAAYLAQRPARAGFVERYALYMLRDRLIVWEYGTRPGIGWFPPGQSFRDYAEPYTTSWRLVAPGAVP